MKRPRKCDIDKCVEKALVKKAPHFFTYHSVGETPLPNSDWVELPLIGLLGGALNTVDGFVGQKGRWTKMQLHLHLFRAFTDVESVATKLNAVVLYRKPGSGAAYTDLFYQGGQLHNPLYRDQFEILYKQHTLVPFTAYPDQWLEAPTATFNVSDKSTFPMNTESGVSYVELALDLPFDVDRSTGLLDGGEIVLLLKGSAECRYLYEALIEYVCID